MLELFRRNQIIYYVFLLVYLLAVYLPNILLESPLASSSGGYLYLRAVPWIENNFLVFKILAIVWIFFQAFLLNSLVGYNRISYTNSLFPGLILILFTCLFRDFLWSTPYVIGNMFLILALRDFYDTDQRNRRNNKVFNTFFFVSLASLFHPVYLIFAVAFIFGMEVYTHLKFKDFLLLVIGLVVPYFLTGTVLYAYDVHMGFVHYLESMWIYGLDWSGINTVTQYLKWAVFILLFLIFLGARMDLLKALKVPARRKLKNVYQLLIFSFGAALFVVPASITNLYITLPFVAILMACLLLIIRNKLLAEIIHLVFLAVMVIFQYFTS